MIEENQTKEEPEDPSVKELRAELDGLSREVEEHSHLANAIGQAKLSNLIGDAAIQAIEGGIDQRKFLIACEQIYADWDKHIKEIIHVRKQSARIQAAAAKKVAESTLADVRAPVPGL